jgi:hypothetical protein
MEETLIPKASCPKCGYRMDRTSDPHGGDARPSEGDASVCLACGNVSVFNSDLSMRQPTAAEKELFDRDPQILEAQMARAYVVGDKLKDRDERRRAQSEGRRRAKRKERRAPTPFEIVFPPLKDRKLPKQNSL